MGAMVTRDSNGRSPGRPRTPIPRDTFLDAAREVFARDGYRGATLAEIAEAAGVTKAAVLHHFGSKKKLYEVTLATIAEDLGQLVLDAIEEPGDFLHRLDRLGERVIRYLGGHPASARLLVRELVDGGPFLGTGGNELVVRALDVTAELLRSGVEAGIIAEQDPRQLAGSIVSLHLMWFAAGPVSSRLSGGDPCSEEQIELRIRAVQDQVRRLFGVPPRY